MSSRVQRWSDCIGVLMLFAVWLLLPRGVSAQEAIVPFQLSFSDPGARSMGFGGAFVALADDATAAFANPAGLVQLLRPEISVEFRRWSHSVPFTVGGRVEGLPSGIGIDNTAGLRTAESEDDVTGLSFLSLVYPRGNWALAVYRHDYANLEFAAETNGLFGGGSSCCQNRTSDQRSTSDMEVVGYGLSAAYRIGDQFDLGLSAVYYDASLRATATEFLWDDDTLDSFFAPNSYLPERAVMTERLLVDGSDWALAGGFLWRLSESWRIGGVYRQGFETAIGFELTAGEAFGLGVPAGEVVARVTGIPVEFPDIYGLGFAYRGLEGHLTVSFQWDRVEYSDLPTSLGLDDQTIDDTDELHLGAEYVFLGSTPIIALRLGVWHEPDHQLRANIDDPVTRALKPRGDDEMHYAAGLGIATTRFQIDFAADFSDRVDTLAVSAIYNF
jgi:long-subunit fatty acid transport protein